MKRIYPILTLFLAVGLLLTACAGAAPTATRAPAAAPAPTTATTATRAPSATSASPTATQAPSGYPAPTATGGAAAPAPTAIQVVGPTTAAAVVRESNISNFTLESFTISVGAKVTWTNRDAVQHTSTAGIPGRIDALWDSDIMDQGKQVSFTFTKAGSFPYWCRIHPQMTGTVTVR